MLLQNKQVAIIGGGPGGLTLARLLQEQGVDIKVYERDADQYVRPQGSALDLHMDTGLKAMTVAGLLDEFKKNYRPGADKAVVVNSRMDILFDERVDKPEVAFGHEHFRPEIDRGPFRDMLIASLKKENVIWNARFTEIKPSGSGWDIFFENGTSVYADLVIAADGANSRLRKYITNIRPVYSGVTAIEGKISDAEKHVPRLWQLINGGSLFALEKGKTIFCITKGDGTLTFLIGLKTPENWLENSGIDLTDRASIAAWFKQEFAAWSPEWQELFATDALSITPRQWYHFPTDQHWKALPNLTMIGDAAHLMPAYAGEGANQALADALDLYEALCCGEFNTIEQAIASFEEKMCKRAGGITEMTLRLTEGFHTENNLQFLMDLFKDAS
ncbi:NAD(P)-binding protein [Chitinophaga oryziterrae]|uniref:NAD(P)-binding protein n=1 Tax=Chitinophaga oryziterrae TaxID=1031224 RepID=A0A6N8JEY0_9BACT|nr:NAD(P)/FAD-dependent oxidoreductase [Chitinophaga oryziterrae]MVT42878.1 NAD(P)-binding protein [Chitinophaga oryziterrae]